MSVLSDLMPSSPIKLVRVYRFLMLREAPLLPSLSFALPTLTAASVRITNRYNYLLWSKLKGLCMWLLLQSSKVLSNKLYYNNKKQWDRGHLEAKTPILNNARTRLKNGYSLSKLQSFHIKMVPDFRVLYILVKMYPFRRWTKNFIRQYPIMRW